jgi:hypothetical protein
MKLMPSRSQNRWMSEVRAKAETAAKNAYADLAEVKPFWR